MEALAGFEAPILLALQSFRIIGLTQLMAFISALGNGAFIGIVAGIVMLFFVDKRDIGIVMILACIVTAIVCCLVLSNIIGRVRPCDAGIDVTAVMGVSRSGYSLPSFHAAAGAAATTVIVLMVGRGQAVPAAALTLLIAFSRLFLGVSFPTDIIAGLIVGVVLGIVVTWVYNQWLGTLIREKFGARFDTHNKRTSVGKGKHSRY